MVIHFQMRRPAAQQAVATHPDLLAIPQVRRALMTSGLRIVPIGDATAYQELDALPSQSLALVLLPFPALAGLSAIGHVAREIEKIRKRAALAPVAFVTEKTVLISEACLPTAVYIVTVSDLDLPRIVSAGAALRHERSWEARNSASTVPDPCPLIPDGAPTRLRLLDSFVSSQTANTQIGNIQIEAMAEAFSKRKGLQTRIAELEHDEQDRLRLLDLWTFQSREIEDAKLQAGEDERLETEKRVLANAEKIHSAAMNAFDLLYEGEASTAASLRLSATPLLHQARRSVTALARFGPVAILPRT